MKPIVKIFVNGTEDSGQKIELVRRAAGDRIKEIMGGGGAVFPERPFDTLSEEEREEVQSFWCGNYSYVEVKTKDKL